jgi:hypothetical protein
MISKDTLEPMQSKHKSKNGVHRVKLILACEIHRRRKKAAGVYEVKPCKLAEQKPQQPPLHILLLHHEIFETSGRRRHVMVSSQQQQFTK